MIIKIVMYKTYHFNKIIKTGVIIIKIVMYKTYHKF